MSIIIKCIDFNIVFMAKDVRVLVEIFDSVTKLCTITVEGDT